MFRNIQFFHINVNCSDLERSLAFYKAIGFKEVIDFGDKSGKEQNTPKTEAATGLGDDKLARILGLRGRLKARARIMMLDDNQRGTRLDLIQWIEPGYEGKPYPHLTHLGAARICFKVKDIDDLYRVVCEAGGKPFSEPLTVDLGPSRQKVFCVPDPDGTVLEFMEFLATEKAA
jgi:predicted lactoylglutathione lyase